MMLTFCMTLTSNTAQHIVVNVPCKFNKGGMLYKEVLQINVYSINVTLALYMTLTLDTIQHMIMFPVSSMAVLGNSGKL